MTLAATRASVETQLNALLANLNDHVGEAQQAIQLAHELRTTPRQPALTYESHIHRVLLTFSKLARAINASVATAATLHVYAQAACVAHVSPMRSLLSAVVLSNLLVPPNFPSSATMESTTRPMEALTSHLQSAVAASEVLTTRWSEMKHHFDNYQSNPLYWDTSKIFDLAAKRDSVASISATVTQHASQAFLWAQHIYLHLLSNLLLNP